MTQPVDNINHPNNSPQHHTGRLCVVVGCSNPAGTAWGPHWCQRHNAERIKRITNNLEAISSVFPKQNSSIHPMPMPKEKS